MTLYFLLFPKWAAAAGWGLVSGSALLLGALIGYYRQVSARSIGLIMGFGSGVLISALAFELMEEAYNKGGFAATAIGFLAGAFLYTGANYLLSHHGARHRKRSRKLQPSEAEHPGSGTAIAIGALIDGIPESVAIGLTMMHGGAVSIAAVIAIFLSNIPESLSSTSGMKKAGRSARFIFGIWIIITLLSGVAALLGFVFFSQLSPAVTGGMVAMAAGGILAMLSNTMIPEAYDEAHDFIGIVTVLGFLAAFFLSKLESN
ncbi:ZIP family zinc transporter [Flaviaesturariibacter flavus]|uniref:ZIP family zinc transporter n=2 Tax=Flaviaesturariibacter flavus TaxID=2502780 RepID=A0A4R1B5B7_9BACT|nr:ZIP family zinc transporter [Flaviaesturariibacter flavus]